ncbi:hypothetical protein I6B53_10220 [Schaalia sp. 19OD2882]|uniref:hypothetical protein n=1 Tax=Schaalia sp. 19OD2882 TaxID=2794089 RepID=UPI001C1EBF29|nr:hypothetical protein [Schaalia sp. 19OD2882]QWW19441.1 hypothetical protein I6B53_10220 [Schaalia sp. 19OD2882]
MMPTSSEPEREQEQWIEIRSLTCKNHAHPPLWKRICCPDDAFKPERHFQIKVFALEDGQLVGKVHLDDAMWFLTDYNSLSQKRVKALIGNLRGTEWRQEDLHSNCQASDWTRVEESIGYSSPYMSLLAKADELGIDRKMFCFGDPQRLCQHIITYRPSVWARNRPWLVAFHDDRAILSPEKRFADEASACDYLLQQLSVMVEVQKRASRRP